VHRRPARPDNEEAGSVFASVKTKSLAIRALVAARIKHVPTAPFDTTIGDPSVDSVDARAYLDIQHTRRIDNVEIMTRGAIDHYHYEGTYAYDTGEAPYAETRSLMKDGTTPTWLTGEVRGRVRKARAGKTLSNVDLVMGSELTAVNAAPQFATADGVDYFRRTDRELQSAAYAQLDGRIARVLVLSTGGRLDYRPSSAGLTMNPRVAAMLDGGDRGRIRASYGTAFREANLYERYYASNEPGSGDAHIATPNLGRENASSFELSAERFFGPNPRVVAVGYIQRLENLMVLTSTEVGDVMFANQDEALGKGVELELEAKWHRAMLRVVGSAQRSEDGKGMELVNSPRSLASATLTAPVGRARLGVESYMVGSRRTVNGDELDPAFVTNVTMTAPHAMGQLDVSLGVRNLFDERWADPGSPDHRQSRIPRDPRTLWVRIGASF
jgi:iron complex outermembrane receptor protein